MAQNMTTVCVALEDREDGGLRVFSDDLAGLVLSGSDRRSVIERIPPAITAIFKEKGLDVTVRSTKPVAEVLATDCPQTLDMNVHRSSEHQSRAFPNIHTKVFVVEMQQAA